MPFVKPPVCYVCGKIHSCDTRDIIQVLAPRKFGQRTFSHYDSGYRTVNVCKHHHGILEEHERQNNLTGDKAKLYAERALKSPDVMEYMIQNQAEMYNRQLESIAS
jgi:hypothetical protein